MLLGEWVGLYLSVSTAPHLNGVWAGGTNGKQMLVTWGAAEKNSSRAA